MAERIERAVRAISEMERMLEDIKRFSKDAKTKLNAQASEEVERAKEKALREVARIMDEHAEKVEREAEEIVQKIASQGEAELKKLREKLERLFEPAVESATNALLSEKS